MNALLLFTVLLCSCSFAQGLQASQPTQSLPSTQDIPFQSDWLKKHYSDRIAMFELQPLRKGDIVFIGDSITEQGMNWGLRFNDLRMRNRGIKGDMTYGVLARLEELTTNQPKAIFIMIGINDVFNFYYQGEIESLSTVASNLTQITEQLHNALPHTEIFVQSLLPDNRDFISRLARSVNEEITGINNKKFTYIDLHSVFSNRKGVLNPALTTDGTHLNAKGYALWKQQLQPYLDKL